MFKNGCPKCGYTVDGNSGRSTGQNDGESPSGRTKRRFKSAVRSKSSMFSDRNGDETLPFWMYILTGLILIGLLFFIMHYFAR